MMFMLCHSLVPIAAWSFFRTLTMVLLSFPHTRELLTTNLLTTACGTLDSFQAKLKSFRTGSNLTWKRHLFIFFPKKEVARKYFYIFKFLLLLGLLNLSSIAMSVCYQCSFIVFPTLRGNNKNLDNYWQKLILTPIPADQISCTLLNASFPTPVPFPFRQ